MNNAKILGILFVSFLSAAISHSVQAADGSSGCGPGWYVFKQNSLVSSSLRSTTNGVLWPTVTVGMTLGTSNCAKHSIVQKPYRSLHYVAHNFDHLQHEAAVGGGEVTAALASVWGCPWSAQTEFDQVLQSNYDLIFGLPGSEPVFVNDQVAGAIAADPVLRSVCRS